MKTEQPLRKGSPVNVISNVKSTEYEGLALWESSFYLFFFASWGHMHECDHEFLEKCLPRNFWESQLRSCVHECSWCSGVDCHVGWCRDLSFCSFLYLEGHSSWPCRAIWYHSWGTTPFDAVEFWKCAMEWKRFREEVSLVIRSTFPFFDESFALNLLSQPMGSLFNRFWVFLLNGVVSKTFNAFVICCN